jgi:hypothetical protein
MEVKNKVLIKGNKMIYIEVGEEVSEEEIVDLFDEIEESLKMVGKDAEVLVNVATSVVIRSSIFRKRLAERIKDMFEEYGFKKISLFAPSLVTRTIASFVIAITQLNNMRAFKSEKEALNWLKKP